MQEAGIIRTKSW